MMWNWFSKLLGKHQQPKRKKVIVDIPYAQHGFSMGHFARPRAKYEADDALASDTANAPNSAADKETAHKST